MDDLLDIAPTFYGSTTVGERGQVVIPADARRDLEITPSTKLLVFSGPGGGGLMLTKAEHFSEFVTKAINMMYRFEEILKKDTDQTDKTDQ
jgi:AbrB family looped-hinge helix DNA binding protein